MSILMVAVLAALVASAVYIGYESVSLFLGTKTYDGAPAKKIRFTRHPELGEYLADENGFALYHFNRDISCKAPTSDCTGPSIVVWPAFYRDSISVDTALDQRDFSAIELWDGNKQLAYKGRPLYRYMNDKKPGDANGEGIGGCWFTIKADRSDDKKKAYPSGLGAITEPISRAADGLNKPILTPFVDLVSKPADINV